jgi:precorrin-2 dehydrogenase/sirohydrochlorin ferrochelatase
MNAMIPLMMDLHDRIVTIFGGGTVGARKAAHFGTSAVIRVISRTFAPAFGELPVRMIRQDLGDATDHDLRRIIGDSFCVIAATSDGQLNERIVRVCKEMGVPVNTATGDDSTFLIPSVVEGEHYQIAITTAGMSPAIPRYVRQVLEKEFASLDGMIELQQELRITLKEIEPSREQRAEILRAVLADAEIWKALEQDPAKARILAKTRYIHE